jgi:hypothetical protein
MTSPDLAGWHHPSVTRPTGTLHAWIQEGAFTVITALARRRIGRRSTPLPPRGEPAHLTAVLRLAGVPVPAFEPGPGQYVYPATTVHVTVTGLDSATRPVADAVRSLAAVPPPAPTFTITGLGCSPDTIFLRCVHDAAYATLRRRVCEAFGVAAPRSVRGWVFDRLSFANVVRFDGPGRWPAVAVPRTTVTCDVLEIARTDRYLSDEGTVVLARLPLRVDPARSVASPP